MSKIDFYVLELSRGTVDSSCPNQDEFIDRSYVSGDVQADEI